MIHDDVPQPWSKAISYSAYQERLLATMARWGSRAACKNSALFLRDLSSKKVTRSELLLTWRLRVGVCQSCPVRLECLHHALNFPELYDVWGGTTPPQRQAMRRSGAGP